MNNLTAGTVDPYWYEWSVGLLYMIKMLNPDNKIKNVVLQSEDSQSLDDVVLTFDDGSMQYIQVKNTRESDKLSFSDMVEGEIEKSYLYKYSSEWREKEHKNRGRNKVVLFTNRKIGNRKYTPKNEWERPPLSQFWKTIKKQAEDLRQKNEKYADISGIIVKKEWQNAWDKWKKNMKNLDAKEQLLFIQSFEILTDQEDLEGLIDIIAKELQEKFKTTHEKAVNLHQKLCYKLMWWATSIGNKKEIEKEDIMEALSLYGDSVKGEHCFPICEPFFESRITFVSNLENKILNGKSRVTFLTGDPGCGKTNIVSYLACKIDSVVTLRFHAFKPIMPGELYVSADFGISDPIDFWGSLLIMIRKLFKGRLYEYSVPISIELIESVDTLRDEVLRLASSWADLTGKPTVIAVDGIDHAARSGNTNTFLRTLPSPETIPENVRFVLAGQPTHQFTEYPDFLSDLDRIEEMQVPDIEKSDLELLYEKNSSRMKYTKHEKALVIDYITKIAKGSTLSGVFAMQEATKYSNFSDFEQNSNVKRLNSGIHSYYEYIWKTAIGQVGNIGYTIDMYLAATFSVINKRISAQTMAKIYGNGISVWQWEDILQNLFPIVTYDTSGYSVFHNDVRLFLTAHYKKANQLLPTISGNIANYLMHEEFDEKIKHEVVFKLLKDSRQEEKYVEVFTSEYVMEAYLLKRDLKEIRQQMLDTLAILPWVEDKRKIVKFSCAVTTMQQHEESLQWLDREYQSDIELPFALDSEKEPVVEALFSMNNFKKIFSDIDALILKNETTRAKNTFLRWLDKRTPGEVFSSMELTNEEDTINELLETWGKYARKFRIAPERKCYEEKSAENAAAYFYRGWLREAVNYSGKDQLKYTLENVSFYFKSDIDDFLQQIIKCGQLDEMEFILNEKMRKVFSERNKISACAWAVRTCKTDLCKGWLNELKDKKFEYISEKWYKQKYTEVENKRDRFKIITDIMYILTYVSEDKFDELIARALEKSEFRNDRSDNIVAENLLVAVNQIAYMEQCILFGCVQKVKIEDFEALLDIILDDRYYNGCFSIDTTLFRKRVLESIIRIIDSFPHALQESLGKSLCVKAETYSEISLLEIYWKYLVSKGKENYVELFFDAWMNSDGMIWKEELSERDYISDVLLTIARKMGWEERIKKAVELINARSIGYIGRKDYSLFNPLQWFERVSKERNQIWEELGWLLMNISEYASTIGDNRAFVQIGNAVSTAAANMSVSSFYRFARMVKTVRMDWVEVVFDGIISALENSLFSETELMQIWEKTVHYFSIDDAAKPYDSQNTKHKIYCADVHKALSLCIKRLGYSKLEECMEKMAPCEYKQRRLERSEHSYIVPARWYESEYYDNMNPFLESVRGMNSDEIFEYIEEQYGKSDFSWDYIKYFIQTAERLDSHSIVRHKKDIVDMLKKRKAEQLEYDGVNRLYNVLFPYLTKDEITDVLTGILTVYHNHQSEGWASADYGLMNDLEDFTFALFSRFKIEDNIWALKEILKMHCMWLTGSYSLTIEPVYNLREECVTTWSDFWSKL